VAQAQGPPAQEAAPRVQEVLGVAAAAVEEEEAGPQATGLVPWTGVAARLPRTGLESFQAGRI
jgi:hypothetical protein